MSISSPAPAKGQKPFSMLYRKAYGLPTQFSPPNHDYKKHNIVITLAELSLIILLLIMTACIRGDI